MAIKVAGSVLNNNKLAKRIIAQKRQTPLKWVELHHIVENSNILAKALYLYWACYRGHIGLIKFILEKD